ncbi:MAG: hypothetical protein ACJA0B_001212 [Alcanivorax borkumensis]|jgi:hypothetical protein
MGLIIKQFVFSKAPSPVSVDELNTRVLVIQLCADAAGINVPDQISQALSLIRSVSVSVEWTTPSH